MSVSNIEALTVLRSNAQFHEVALVNDRNERLRVNELSDTAVLSQGQNAYVGRNDRILAIDIRAESFAAVSDVLVTVRSQEGYPSLTLTQF